MKRNQAYVVPQWERGIFQMVKKGLVERGGETPLEKETLKIWPQKPDLNLEELIGKYGSSAIKNAQKHAGKIGANLVLLYPGKDLGSLEVDAVYYSI